MFYEITAKAHVRVPPTLMGEDIQLAISTKLNEDLEGYISADHGFVISVSEIMEVGEGIMVPGDGAPYYNTTFKFMTFVPEMQEVVTGKITDIAGFGAFINIGPVDGMIHVSQTMDDFVSVSKQKTLAGKESKRVLKVGDICRARIISVSYKDLGNPKLGLTMRQPYLGCLKWLEDKKKK